MNKSGHETAADEREERDDVDGTGRDSSRAGAACRPPGARARDLGGGVAARTRLDATRRGPGARRLEREMWRVTVPRVKNVVVHFKVRASEAWKTRRYEEEVRARVEEDRRRDETSETLWRERGKSREWIRKRLTARRRAEGRHHRRGRGGTSGNFFTFRLEGGKLSFTVFPASGNGIVTGIARPRNRWRALVAFGAELGLLKGWLEWAKIVNSTYAGGVEWRNVPGQEEEEAADKGGQRRRVSACRALVEFHKANVSGPASEEYKKDVSVSFRSQFFPGARIRWRGIGTVNLFNNGNYVIVGVKNATEARRLYARVCAIIKDYSTC